MYNWRNKGERSYQEHPRMKSAYYNAKPPLGGNPNWLPSWEKEFVTQVGAMSWRKFLEGKRYVHLDNKIMNWDDLAGKEAFNTSKDNFHAKVRGLPYIKPHNPDLYIDEIDWDAKIDHVLYQDFDSDSMPLDSDSDREPVLIFGDALPDPLKNYSPFGWGDEDETAVCQNKNGFNYDDYVNKWDVDVEALASQWYSHQNDEKAHEDQGWNDDKKNNWGSDNNNDGNVNNQNDDKAHGDQGWNDDETNNWGSNNNNYYGNVNNPNDNEAPGNQGWIDVKKNNWGSNNNSYYGNVNNQNDDEAPGDQGWIDVKKNNWGSNNNNYYGNVNNGGGRYKNWRCNGNNNNNNNYWRNNGNNNKNEAGRNNGNKNKNEAWRNNGNRRKQVGQAHGSQRVNQVHQ